MPHLNKYTFTQEVLFVAAIAFPLTLVFFALGVYFDEITISVIIAIACNITIINKIGEWNSIHARKFRLFKSLIGKIAKVNDAHVLILDVTKRPKNHDIYVYKDEFYISYMKDNKVFWLSSFQMKLFVDDKNIRD